MKLIRIGELGKETPCLLDKDGKARDVSSLVHDFKPATISNLGEVLGRVKLSDLPIIETKGVRIGAPISQPQNIFCIGLNYSDHAKEANMPVPEEPILFNKSSVTYCGPNDDLLYSPQMTKLDWEVELGIFIGKEALNISEAEAHDAIFGYTVVNDVSERAWQIERGGQWVKGKSFPNFCPTGPYLVSSDEVKNPKALEMWLDVNGERKQSGNTSTMVFAVYKIVSYMSEFMRLMPGDLICTGTPPGVGMGMKPPQYLKIGDKVSLGIEGLGEQSQTVVKI